MSETPAVCECAGVCVWVSAFELFIFRGAENKLVQVKAKIIAYFLGQVRAQTTCSARIRRQCWSWPASLVSCQPEMSLMRCTPLPLLPAQPWQSAHQNNKNNDNNHERQTAVTASENICEHCEKQNFEFFLLAKRTIYLFMLLLQSATEVTTTTKRGTTKNRNGEKTERNFIKYANGAFCAGGGERGSRWQKLSIIKTTHSR